MPGIQDVFTTLHNVVLNHMRAGGLDAGGGLIAFEFGTPIPDDTFQLSDAGATVSPTLAVEFMSAHADTLPEITESMFRRRSLSVDDQYMLLLSGSTASKAETVDMFGLVKRQALADFEPTLGALNGMYRFRPVYASPINWYDLAETSNWTSISIGGSDNPPPRSGTLPKIDPELTKWQVVPQRYKPWLDRRPTKKSLRTMSPRQSFDTMEVVPDLRRSGDAEFRSHAITALKPSVLSRFKAEKVVRTVGLPAATTEILPMVRKTVPFTRKFDTLKVSDAPLSYVATNLNQTLLQEATARPISGDRFSISFGLCFVKLSRPWLSNVLLNLPGWYVPNYGRASFCDAAAASGPMAYLPTGCILIRDLKIGGQWSGSDRSAIEGSSIFGGFSLLGRSYDRETATISVPGMQSIGWLCEPMPNLPPDDQPTA
ncbi:hypothetical protein [Shinella sp.]|uniref:hypothetical protein n=1 Tax=Shinella sp. TaxID=1870904 RepID=UPI0039E59BFC